MTLVCIQRNYQDSKAILKNMRYNPIFRLSFRSLTYINHTKVAGRKTNKNK